jgi:DNA-directed RNA polymerase subunit RPC12/RpoP
MTQKTSHEWSKEALFAKAQIFAESMVENDDKDWEFGMWSAFTLEMLIRSAVSAVSPTLIAGKEDWANLLFALGGQPKRAKFVPKSAVVTELLARAEDLVPDFTREHANFCTSHFARRNSELHTGAFSFENAGTTWLPMFYATCEILLKSIGESLESLFGRQTAKRAREDIDALRDDTAKSVNGTINAHKTIWEQKSEEERASATAQAKTASLRHYGHRVSCPSCGSTALLQGKPAGEPKRTVEDDGIYERRVMKPEAFSCLACGLRIAGFSKLLAAKLGNTFISTSHYDAVEFFNIDIERRMREMMEDDNNEY